MIDKITHIVDGFKGAPAMLAVVVLQLATLGVVYFTAAANADRQQARELALIDRCSAGN